MYHKIIIGIIGALIIAGLVGFFSKNQNLLVDRVETHHKTWIEANFSDTECEEVCEEICDSNGKNCKRECGDECETEYWELLASDVWEIYTLTDEESGFNIVSVHGKQSSIPYKVTFPSRTVDFSRDFDFDYYDKKQKLIVKVWVNLGEETEDYITIPESKYQKAVNAIGTYIEVKTWYGVRYGSKF